MADQKITQLSADTTPTSDDLVVTVNDPLGTPANRKVTLAALALGIGGAWTAYTPTITANTGTFTSVSGSGRYIQIGKLVIASGSIVITTNGTAAGSIVMTLPVTAATANIMIGYGRGNAVSGAMQQIATQADTTKSAIWNASGTYGGASGETIIFEVVYEAA